MAPLAWVRRVVSEVPELNVIPLFGHAPFFDWHHLSSTLAARFGIPQLSIHSKEQKMREGAEIRKGLGTNLLTLPISISPLGSAYWIMSREDMTKLTSWAMKPASKARALSSEILQEGFYRYLTLEALECIQGMEPFQPFSFQLSEEESSVDRAFCIDIEIQFEAKSCWGRLVIPDDLRTAWIQHYSQMPSQYIPAEIARQTQLVVGVKTGSVLLHQDDWDQIKVGDFVLLDEGSYDPNKGTGIALLMLQSTPIFNVKIKQNKIELVDYAFYYEENMEQKGQTPSQRVEKLPAHEGEVVALKELPLYVTVEIARLKITLDQLMHLSPGNVLEIPVRPEQGVSLTVNGQTVGRAELVHLGENLGLRILEIG